MIREILLKWVVNTASLFVVMHFFRGIYVDRWQTAVISAVALTMVNSLLKPIILVLTFPLTILSLGLFTLFVNGLMFYAVSKIIPGFTVTSFTDAFWGALIFSMTSMLLNLFVGSGKNTGRRHDSNFIRSKYSDVIETEVKEE